jgi:hypothetical protein
MGLAQDLIGLDVRALRRLLVAVKDCAFASQSPPTPALPSALHIETAAAGVLLLLRGSGVALLGQVRLPVEPLAKNF